MDEDRMATARRLRQQRQQRQQQRGQRNPHVRDPAATPAAVFERPRGHTGSNFVRPRGHTDSGSSADAGEQVRRRLCDIDRNG